MTTDAPTLRTLRLIVEYDGTDFAGWQRQTGQRTVQQCLEEAFATMTGGPVCVRGAGRTDAGVHADGQVASVEIASRIPALGFMRGLNSNLPRDIAVLDVADMPAGFNARWDARGKIYRYLIWNHPVRSPRRARDSWHVFAPLDVHAMREAAALFCGEHDFRAFRAADCERRTTVRVLRRFDVHRDGGLIACEVQGTAFLKNMVRILVGTLVAVGQGKMPAATIRELLTHGDRTKAGMTAPACGLTLAKVIY
ncbi:MAG: tRNA pseudouridine(38-40) synthase TruA [Polyangia bacterium]